MGDGELRADITRRFLWTLNRMLGRGAVTKQGWGAAARWGGRSENDSRSAVRYLGRRQPNQGAKRMPDISATLIGQITGVMSSDDGNHVLIRTEPSPGIESVFALKRDQLCNLIDLLALGHMQCRKIHGVPLEQRDVYATTWWEIGFDPASGVAILSLTFGAGGRLDFALPGAMPMQILETLRAHLEPSTSQTHEKPLN